MVSENMILNVIKKNLTLSLTTMPKGFQFLLKDKNISLIFYFVLILLLLE